MEISTIIRDELQQILEVSKNTALEDSRISNDEAQLIELLEKQLNKIDDELHSIIDLLDDNLSEEEIRNRVRLVAREIIPKLTSLAKEDEQVTADEAAILDQIVNKIIT